jgi:hypothetical protein
MTQIGADFYPQEDPEWDALELSRAAAHELAMRYEAYTHEVADVRRQFFGLLMAHSALEDGLGWGIFDDDPPGNVAEQGARDVLLFCGAAEGETMGGHIIPAIRILVNEPFTSGDKTEYLTEDISILPGGVAAYAMSSVEVSTDPSDGSGTLKKSSGHIFTIQDGHLILLSPKDKAGTSVPIVKANPQAKEFAMPWGDGQDLDDQTFALARAREILDSIAHITPSYHHEY